MKKRLALVLAGVMMVSSLAGCGSSKPAATTAAAAASETTAAAGDAKEEKTAEVHYPVGMYFIHQKGRKALFLLV